MLGWPPSDDNEGDDDDPSDIENGNESPYRSRRPRGTQDPLGPYRPRALMAPTSNPHAKFPIFSVMPDEDTESHLSSDWINSKGIVDIEKCVRFCLTPAGNARLWYESIHPIDNVWPNL